MNTAVISHIRLVPVMALLLLVGICSPFQMRANPTGGTVAAGAATFNTAGSQLTINQKTANAYINWQSFNIGAGETTTFVQPSSSSVVWNQINDVNPSQILGNLNANGYVFLQNANGFYVGGDASISAHGLVMTTANIPAPDLSSSGPWSFTAPPPTAKIVNYGRIQTTDGGSAFLIASDIENNGTISAPGGKIGLYAGEKVLVSMSPDGRGLSAEVTLPSGSVDNEGKLIADAGSIAAQAKFVNQDGFIQADSIKDVNGTIELVASDAVNLGAKSTISAQGGSTGASSGGSVFIDSDDVYSDEAGSMINISGGVQGGNGGQVSLCAKSMNSISSKINGQAMAGFVDGILNIDPYNIELTSYSSDPNAQYSGTVLSSDPPSADTLTLNVNAFSPTLSQINLAAVNDITFDTIWYLTDPGVPAALKLTAGNNIIFNNGSGIDTGKNWSVNLTAGASVAPGTKPDHVTDGIRSDGIYLDGNSYIKTQDGSINLWAANEVLIDDGTTAAGNGIRTLGGGSISVTAEYGNVNTGANPQGFSYKQPPGRNKPILPPYYSASPILGGISTAAGGDVTISAGGDVTSYNPSGSTAGADAGTGAFGSQLGNVNITAGGNVYGHYVLVNGVGTINAGKNIGVTAGSQSFALSLVNGAWNVNAPNGTIYLQEVRNPNGVFNTVGSAQLASYHLFDYGADATVNLSAEGVDITETALPRGPDLVQAIFPPILDISTGSGGVTLQDTLTLFPSADQGLNITTTGGGNLVSDPNNPGTTPEILMSDSSQVKWVNASTFSDKDHDIKAPVQVGNSDPVVLNISGDMDNFNLITTKATQITVDGNMNNCGFSGQNLSANDPTMSVTFIHVGGTIFNQSPYNFLYDVSILSIPTQDLFYGMVAAWDNIFSLALDPAKLANLTVPSSLPPSQWAAYALTTAGLFGVTQLPNGQLVGVNPGFIYNMATERFGYAGPMDSSVNNALGLMGQPITVLRLSGGTPVLDAKGHFVTDTVSWAPPADVQSLYNSSQGPPQTPDPLNGQLGYRIGGPGQFDISAGNIDLGNTYGILSSGVADPTGGFYRYGNLAPLMPGATSGATVNVMVSGDLTMLTSTIAAIGGGDVNVSAGGSIDLGSQELLTIKRQVGFGVFTSGNGNVNVTASGDVDINGSRIASFNGGNIFVESYHGTVNVGSGGNQYQGVGVSYVDPVTGEAGYYAENVYGSGIVATTLVDPSLVPGSASLPGNITVNTPQGDIVATLGGILQLALNGNLNAGPTITLNAGTFPPGSPNNPDNLPEHVGNINLGQSGVIGGSVNLSANGNISGVVVSRQGSTINAAQNFTGTLLSAGSANVTAGGSVSGTIIGVGGASVSGSSVSASVLGQNVSVNGGAATSTLGSSANATTSSQAASQQASQTADQVASTDTGDDDKKKKKPTIQKTSRVTVILSAATPGS